MRQHLAFYCVKLIKGHFYMSLVLQIIKAANMDLNYLLNSS